MKRCIAAVLSILVFNLTYTGCSTASYSILDLNDQAYSVLEKHKVTESKGPIKGKEIVVSIPAGPLAGAKWGMISKDVNGYIFLDIGGGSEKEQIKKFEENKGILLLKNYTKVMALFLNKHLSKKFNKVTINEGGNEPGPSTYVSSPSFLFEIPASCSHRAKFTLVATPRIGAPITATGEESNTYFNTLWLLPIGIIFFPVGLVVGYMVTRSVYKNSSTYVIAGAMDKACESLAAQLAARYARVKDEVVELNVAITGISGD